MNVFGNDADLNKRFIEKSTSDSFDREEAPAAVYDVTDATVSTGWGLVQRQTELFVKPGMRWSPAFASNVAEKVAELKRNGQLEHKLVDCEGILLSFPGSYTYGHVLIDYTTRIFLARMHGIDQSRKFIVQSPIYGWAASLLALNGIIADNWIEVGQNQSLTVTRLLIPTIPGAPGRLLDPAGAALRRLKLTADAILGPSPVKGRRLFVEHIPQTSLVKPRILPGLETVRDIAIEQYGFESFSPAHHSILDQIKVFREADVIVGQDSSALHNVCWTNRATLVVLTDVDRINPYHYILQRINKGRLGIVCLPCDVSEINRCFDKALKGS